MGSAVVGRPPNWRPRSGPSQPISAASCGGSLWKAKQMDRLGMEVIPAGLRDDYAFRRGLHCCTADVRREGGCEDHFGRG